MPEESKHTPGPWEFKDGMQLAIGPIQDPEGQAVCIITGHAGQAFANAELIASAPRLKVERDALLAALEALVDDVYFLLRPENPPCQKLSIDRRERWASVIEAKKIIAKIESAC